MKSRFRKITIVFCFFLLSSPFWGCAPASSVVKVIELNRERYVCKIDPVQFNAYQGKRILLSTIEDQSKNTSNLYYYNPQKTIGYKLYYDYHSMQQPVVSYYWYALKKAFECAGLTIEEYGPIYDAELSLIFHSLTDEEMVFKADLIKNHKMPYSKILTVRMPEIKVNVSQSISVLNTITKPSLSDPISAKDAKILEQRAYGMLDSIVTTILSDPEFKKALLDESASIDQPPSESIINFDYTQKLIVGQTTQKDIQKDLGNPIEAEKSSNGINEYWAYFYRKSSNTSASSPEKENADQVIHKLILKFDDKGVLTDYRSKALN